MRLTPIERKQAMASLQEQKQKTARVIEDLDGLIERCNGHCNGRQERDKQ